MSGPGATLAFLLLALATAGWLAGRRDVRAALATVGGLLIAYALPFELSGLVLLGGWTVLAVAAFAVAERFAAAANIRGKHGFDVGPAAGPYGVAALCAGLALVRALLRALPPAELWATPAVPLSGVRLAATTILIGGFGLAAGLARKARLRGYLIAGMVGVAAYYAPFELAPAWTVVAWSGLAAGSALLASRARAFAPAPGAMGAALAGLGLAVTAVAVAPPTRLVVDAGLLAHAPFLNAGTAALLALAGAVVALNRSRGERRGRWPSGLAVGLLVYALSIGVVELFQARVTLAPDPETFLALQRQAQVALSVLWAALGGGAFVAGVLRARPELRLGGLGLLVLATAKVFLYDLSSLDATYRVPSFIGLGVLLLLSSYVYQRGRRRDASETGTGGRRPA